MIEREKIDLSEERRILSQMIVSTPFLSGLQGIARSELFQSSYTQIVSRWVWEYFNHTNEAPEKALEDIFIKKRKDVPDEDDQEMIAEFLHKLSADWSKGKVQNVSYNLHNAIDFFKLRSLDRLREQIQDSVEQNDSAIGERLVSEYRRVEKLTGKGVNILKDRASIAHAYSQEHEFLFSYPGSLGKAIGKFCRGDFFAILGAMKRGKTYYLWYTGYRAAMMGLKVLFVSLEMTEPQMLRRAWQTFVGQPVKNGVVQIPEFRKTDNGKWDVNFREEQRKGIDLGEIAERQQKYQRAIRTGEIKMIPYPSYSASIETIETDLINLEYYEDFLPDADIVDPSDRRSEYRHQLNRIWMALRGMAAARNVLVVTGSQTNREGLNRDAGAKNLAEDIRKLAHVTKMIVLNQTEAEFDRGIIRIETIAQREGKPHRGQIIVLQCYDIGRPYIDSKSRSEVNLPGDKDKEKKSKKKDE
jgi:hypothetical protein